MGTDRSSQPVWERSEPDVADLFGMLLGKSPGEMEEMRAEARTRHVQEVRDTVEVAISIAAALDEVLARLDDMDRTIVYVGRAEQHVSEAEFWLRSLASSGERHLKEGHEPHAVD